MKSKNSASIKKLKLFARNAGLSMRSAGKKHFNNHAPGAVAYYNHAFKIIRFCDEYITSHDELMYTLAHEMGHALDFSRAGKKECKLFCKALQYSNYMLDNNIHIPIILRDFLILREHRASDIGEKILKHLNIKLDSRNMKRWRNESIRSYKKILS